MRFHNLTDSALADLIGIADAAARIAGEELEGLKAEFKRRALAHAIGEQFEVKASAFTQTRLDTKALRDAFPPETLAPFEKSAPASRMTIKPLAAALLAAAE